MFSRAMEINSMPKPIIVCGMARSGTTFVRNLFNSHSDIAMSDEFFLYKYPSISSLFSDFRVVLEAAGNRGELGPRKALVMYSLWFAASSDIYLEETWKASYFGNKTPGAEHDFEFYEDVFAACPPTYVYVMRNPVNVFISRLNMNWGPLPNIRQQIGRYLKSIARYEEALHRFADRVQLLQIDKMGGDYEARLSYVETLFSKIGLPLDDKLKQFVKRWKPAQTAKSKLKRGQKLVTALSEEDVSTIRAHSKIMDVIEKYGYEVQ